MDNFEKTNTIETDNNDIPNKGIEVKNQSTQELILEKINKSKQILLNFFKENKQKLDAILFGVSSQVKAESNSAETSQRVKNFERFAAALQKNMADEIHYNEVVVDSVIPNTDETNNVENNPKPFEEEIESLLNVVKACKKGDFETAYLHFMTANNFDKSVICEAYPEFREFYEKREFNKSKEWLDNSDNKVDANFRKDNNLNEILKYPQGIEKENALKEYKKNLTIQKEAVGYIISFIKGRFQSESGLDIEDLNKQIDIYATKFVLSSGVEHRLQESIEKFIKKQENAELIMDKYKTDSEIFKAISGQEPEGQIQVFKAMGSIAIRVENKNDFINLRNKKEIANGIHRPIEVSINETKAQTSLIVEYVGDSFYPIDKISYSPVLLHEEQHNFKDLFNKPHYKMYMQFDKEYVKSAEESIQKREIGRLLEYKRQKLVDDDVVDEILARFRERPYFTDSIAGVIVEDYKFGESYINKQIQDLSEEFGESLGKEKIEEYVKDVFVTKYEKVIKKGINAINSLIEKGYAPDQIIGLLINETLSNWPKVSKRLLESINE